MHSGSTLSYTSVKTELTCWRKFTNFIFNGVLGVVSLSISIFLFVTFMNQFVIKKVKGEDKYLHYFIGVFFTWSYMMAIWCLIKTYFGNPGYVSDYYYSHWDGGAAADQGEEVYEIYRKEKNKEINTVKEQVLLTVKVPIEQPRILEAGEKPMQDVKSFYRF